MAILDAAQTARLAQMAGEAHKATSERMLDDAALDLIAENVAQLKDDSGLLPGDIGYVVTVDLYRAAAEAWRVKAGMVADGYDFKAEGASYTRSQMFEHYLAQAARYASMASQLTVSIERPNLPEENISNAWEDFIETGGGLP